MTAPDKKEPRLGSNQVEASWEKEATTGILTTAACAVCFLLAFAYLRGTEQLLLASIGGMLATGGAR
jgi:hypothetical protein